MKTYCSSKPHHKIDKNVKETKISQQICGGNRSRVAEEGSRYTNKTQLDEVSEHDIFERHASNRYHILQSVDKLILQKRKLIPAFCNADDSMSIAGAGDMIINS